MTSADPVRAHSLAVMADPSRWRAYPFLPVARARPGGVADFEAVFDAFGFAGWTGFSATAFLDGLTDRPDTPSGLLALPPETFDTPAEVLDAGWRVD